MEPDQNSSGYSSCRYRVSFVARRGLPDSLTITFLRPFFPLRIFVFLILYCYLYNSLLGCGCSCLRHCCVTKGEEAHSHQEDSRKEGRRDCEVTIVICLRSPVSLFHCHPYDIACHYVHYKQCSCHLGSCIEGICPEPSFSIASNTLQTNHSILLQVG